MSTTEEDVTWHLRNPFLVRLTLYCFRSYHFHPFVRMKSIEKVFFSGVSVKLAACAANTWLPIFVLSWEIKFTLRNYCCIWGGREREERCEAPKSGSFICGTSEVRMGIVAFSKIRNFAGYYRTIFIYKRRHRYACVWVCVWMSARKRSMRKETNTNSHEKNENRWKRNTRGKNACVCVCVCLRICKKDVKERKEAKRGSGIGRMPKLCHRKTIPDGKNGVERKSSKTESM